jgi:hypothetical protein
METIFNKFKGSSFFPDKESKWEIFKTKFHCLIGWHILRTGYIDGEKILFCENCKFTEKNKKRIKRDFSKDITFKFE